MEWRSCWTCVQVVCRGAVRIQLLAGPSGYSTFALRFGGAVAREAAYC